MDKHLLRHKKIEAYIIKNDRNMLRKFKPYFGDFLTKSNLTKMKDVCTHASLMGETWTTHSINSRFDKVHLLIITIISII